MFSQFKEIWLADFEFNAPPGERPTVVCLVARELKSGRTLRLWADQLGSLPPYPTGPDVLFVAYYSSAELTCHLALGWPMPVYVLDLYVEFRNVTNGLDTLGGNGLLGVLAAYQLHTIGASEKKEIRDLIMRGGPWNADERAAILEYCESDVVALERLLPAMVAAGHIDLPRAVHRGRYMRAVAVMEHIGVPIDTHQLARMSAHWHAIQEALIARIDADYGVFEGRTFKQKKFESWLARAGLPWPRLRDSDKLDMSEDIFRQMAKAYPIVAPLRELRTSLAELRLNRLAVGRDGRNRTLLSPFRARTGRNQPSNSKFVFGPAAWMRGLIKPPPGHGVAYIDWSQQEFGIAAALSGDGNMIKAYESGDPYLAFAKLAGAVPPDATKKSHKAERDLYKACTLAVQYGMGPEGLAGRIGQPPVVARDLLRKHLETFRVFWRWSDAVQDTAMLTGRLRTVFGWTLHIGQQDANLPGLSLAKVKCGTGHCVPKSLGVLPCSFSPSSPQALSYSLYYFLYLEK